jgi:hypothetical protein
MASHVRNLALESVSPKVGKTLNPSAERTFPTMSKPSVLEDTNASTGATSNPTSPSATNSGCDAAHQLSRPVFRPKLNAFLYVCQAQVSHIK